MAVTIVKPTHSKQHRIYQTLKNLEIIPKITVSISADYDTIDLKHEQEFVPDFQLKWCTIKLHYRVYILVADAKNTKKRAGYCICTIQNAQQVMQLATFYGFLHTRRPNNRSEADAT